jgi:hypothetical protein
MKLLFSGSIFGDQPTLRRLELWADEIGVIGNFGSFIGLGENGHQEYQPTSTDVKINNEVLRAPTLL